MMMNKILSTTILFLITESAIGQKGIEGLIQAEKNFAAYSLAHTTKEAFQQFIDSNSIMFDDGKPVKAIEFWEKREKNTGVLNWWPQYAEISASGDFGYTTGPWTFQVSAKDTIVARGQYTTVWHINKDDEWKFLVDLGVSNTSADSMEDVRIIDTPIEPETRVENVYPLVVAENSFNQMLAKKKEKAYKTWLSGESILNRNGSLPAVTSSERRNIIDSTPAGIKFTTNGWNISPAPDIGYTFGTTVITDKTENYLRIWRREKSGWKIAVEVLRY